MSTEIRSMFGKKLTIAPDDEPDRVEVILGGTPGMLFDRADFLAAVATECDAIVIPRETLPGVIEDRHGLHVDGVTVDSVTTAADAMQDALGMLALAEHRKSHPPVEAADVEALAKVLAADEGGIDVWERYAPQAIRLLATGRIEVRP